MVIGVDHGGTWTRVAISRPRGGPVSQTLYPAPALNDFPRFFKERLGRAYPNIHALIVGSKGVWKQAPRRRLKRGLQGLTQKLVVMSDVEAAFWSAFPHGKGILLISGTGSIAYGRKSARTWARAGGLGPRKGDEGSGYWIGKRWSSIRNQSITGKSVRRIAQRAREVKERAQHGDRRAQQVMSEAQGHLARLVHMLQRKLRWSGPLPLALHGSVLRDPFFQRGFLQELKRRGVRFRHVPCPENIAVSLVRLGQSPRRLSRV